MTASLEWSSLLGTTPWEITATLCAVCGVLLIARQNALGWPLGIVWSLISAWLAFFEWNLVSDAILYVTYVPIQAYCWITWRRAAKQELAFRPVWLPRKIQILLLGSVVLAVALWGLGVMFLSDSQAWLPAPALLWRDAASTVLNYFAQFLQARKRMENWIGWLLVNLLGVHIYWVQGSAVYAVQYGFFLALGIYGWWAWRRAMKEVKP